MEDITQQQKTGRPQELKMTDELARIFDFVAPNGIGSDQDVSIPLFIVQALNDDSSFLYKFLQNTVGPTVVNAIVDHYTAEIMKDIPNNFSDQEKYYAFVSSDKVSESILSTLNFFLALWEKRPGEFIVTRLKEEGLTTQKIMSSLQALAALVRTEGPEAVLGGEEAAEANSQTPSFFLEIVDVVDTFVSVNGELTNKIINTINKEINKNVIVTGERGVGKTSLIAELFERIRDKNCPHGLCGAAIVTTRNDTLFPGSKAMQLNINPDIVMNELEGFGVKKVLVIDNMEDLLECDEYMAKRLLNYCDNVGIPVIGLCDTSNYEQLCRAYDLHYYQKFTMEKPSYENAELILSSIREELAKIHHHKIEGLNNRKIVELAEEYIKDTVLPGSAVNLLDHTLSKLGVDSETSTNLVLLRGELKLAMRMSEKNKEEADIKQHKINELKKSISKESRRLRKVKVLHIDNNIIFNVLSEITGLDINYFNNDMHSKLLKLEDNLNHIVVGQEEAVKEVSRSVKRGKLGLGRDNKPRGVFLFVAPSGVGKTYLAKSLAKELYGSEKSMIRVDMSEHINKESINTLIGSARGYVGSEAGGMLTEAVRNNPNSVILLDEFEKACDEVMNLFLQVFDDGRLTDGLGETVDFKNTFIILTSNIGTKEANDNRTIGFGGDSQLEKTKRHREIIEKEIKKRMKPELLNRFDKIVYFKDLTKEEYLKIARLELDKACQRCKKIGYILTYNDDVVEAVAKMKKDEIGMGARPILRNIENYVEDPMTDAILENPNIKNFAAVVENETVVVKPM